jgi:periplasmic protein CpxP/Spy
MMMTIRKTGMRMAMVALCGGVLCTLPVMAQDAAPAPAPAQDGAMGGRGGGMQARQMDMMTKKLNLTSDQQTQIKAINQDSMKQMMALRNDTSMSQDDKRSKMMDIRKTSNDKIRGILTDEQKPKFDEMQAQMRERMKERRQGGDASPQ